MSNVRHYKTYRRPFLEIVYGGVKTDIWFSVCAKPQHKALLSATPMVWLILLIRQANCVEPVSKTVAE